MVCEYCGVEIPRGKKYKPEGQYKSKNFCSEECYNKYCEYKEQILNCPPSFDSKVNLEKEEQKLKADNSTLKKYISQIYGKDSDNINWGMLNRQIQSIIKKYDLTYDQIYSILYYAVEYEHHIVNPDVYLGQFIPQYLEKYNAFQQRLEENGKTKIEIQTKKIEPKKLSAIRHRRNMRR